MLGSFTKIGLTALAVASVTVAVGSRPAVSANAQPRIAFQSARGCGGIQSSWGGVVAGDIYTVRPDGSDLQQVTHDCYSSAPAWSPAGDRFAVVSTKDGRPGIFVLDATGASEQRLSPTDVAAWQPAWSRLGRIAFAVDWPTADQGIWVVNPDGSGSSRLTSYGELPAWSPAGDRIAFDDPARNAVLVMRPDGTNIQQIGSGRGPAYAPTGDRIAWTALAGDGKRSITIAGVDGTNPRAIFTSPVADFRIAWSPDAASLAFVMDTSSTPDLYVIAASGGTPPRVTANAATDTDPDWQPAVPSTGLSIERIAFAQRACATRKSIATVTVADAQGRPLQGAVVVMRGGPTTVRALTDGSGHASLSVKAAPSHRGRLVLTVVANQASRPTATKKVSLPGCR
jgi:Tol biopolymer transport system component